METAVGISVASDDDASVKEHDQNTLFSRMVICPSILVFE